tara:strand:- start:56 stop:295 length:240 start_codon:yes stop_codon:yes gene_type:complete
MWMIALILATTAGLSSALFRPDIMLTAELIWPDKAECNLVREAQLSKHPAPEHAALVCLRVPDFIADKFSPTLVPSLKI